MKNRQPIVPGIIILAVLFPALVGCSSITQNEAEQKAISFVNSNVKFFSKDSEAAQDLPDYKVDSVSSYKESKDWMVVMHVSAMLNNETKKNDIAVRIGSSGDVLELNGKEVPR